MVRPSSSAAQQQAALVGQAQHKQQLSSQRAATTHCSLLLCCCLVLQANHHNGCPHSHLEEPCRPGSADRCIVWRAGSDLAPGEEVCNGYKAFLPQDRAVLQVGGRACCKVLLGAGAAAKCRGDNALSLAAQPLRPCHL